MAEQEEISELLGDSAIDTSEKLAAAEDLSLHPEPKAEVEKQLPEVIAATERKIPNLFGRKNHVQKALGGGKPADLFLWRDKKLSALVLGGATVLWILFEILDYHLLTLVCHILIFTIGLLFLWSNATLFINKRSPHIPDIHLPEEPFRETASFLRVEINRALAEFRGIASGRDLKKFLSVVGALWVVSIVGGAVNFLTLVYIAIVLLFTVPIFYEKNDDKVDALVEKAISEIKKQYAVLDAKVISKIPKLPLDKKKD